MITDEIKTIVSKILWNTGAIKVSTGNPFKLVSGNLSPIYVDCRIPISFPFARNIITDFAVWICDHEKLDFDYVAGGETAGIPYAAWLSDRLNKPMVYIRKSKKDYGKQEQIEGYIEQGRSVLLYEDLVTDAKSKLSFVLGIRNAGCIITDCLVVFDRHQGGTEELAKEGIRLFSMSDMLTTLDVGFKNQLISQNSLNSVKEYLQNAKSWHEKRGFDFID